MKREETSSNGGEVESSGSGEGEGGGKVGDTVAGANGEEAREVEGEARTETNRTRKPAEVSVHHLSLSCSHGYTQPPRRCLDCRQFLDDSSLKTFLGDPENAVSYTYSPSDL